MGSRPAITDLTLPELEKRLVASGVEKWRGLQILRWVHLRRAASFDSMTDLSRDLRTRLSQRFRVGRTRLRENHASPDETDNALAIGAD